MYRFENRSYMVATLWGRSEVVRNIDSKSPLIYTDEHLARIYPRKYQPESLKRVRCILTPADDNLTSTLSLQLVSKEARVPTI